MAGFGGRRGFGRGGEGERREPAPKPITPEWLLRAGIHYLERYASSTENLRRVLERKVARRAAALGVDAAEFAPAIEATVARLAEMQLLDDRTFAESRLATLRRRGASTRMAGMKLAAKGVGRELAEEVIAGDETSEAAAANTLARRRRLGVHRTGGEAERAEKRERDIAVLVRAGFSFDLARRAVEGTLDEE